jgi:hypothetical protein
MDGDKESGRLMASAEVEQLGGHSHRSRVNVEWACVGSCVHDHLCGSSQRGTVLGGYGYGRVFLLGLLGFIKALLSDRKRRPGLRAETGARRCGYTSRGVQQKGRCTVEERLDASQSASTHLLAIRPHAGTTRPLPRPSRPPTMRGVGRLLVLLLALLLAPQAQAQGEF